MDGDIALLLLPTTATFIAWLPSSFTGTAWLVSTGIWYILVLVSHIKFCLDMSHAYNASLKQTTVTVTLVSRERVIQLSCRPWIFPNCNSYPYPQFVSTLSLVTVYTHCWMLQCTTFTLCGIIVIIVRF